MWLRLLLFGLLAVFTLQLAAAGNAHGAADIDENEFAEFEEFDNEDEDSGETANIYWGFIEITTLFTYV